MLIVVETMDERQNFEEDARTETMEEHFIIKTLTSLVWLIELTRNVPYEMLK